MNGLRDDRLRSDLAELAELARPTDLHDRVVAASRRAQTRRVIGAAAAFVVLAGAGAFWAALRGAEPDAIAPADPTATVLLPEAPLAYYDPSMNTFDAGPLAHATLTVPAWVGTDDCPAGRRTFIKDGVAVEGGILVHIVAAQPTDVDGDGSTEQVVVLRCAVESGQPLYHYQVLALTDLDAPDGPVTMGRVMASGQTGVVGVFGLEVKPDGTIRVKVGDGDAAQAPTAQVQWREYAWQGTGFAQTGGETNFAEDAPAVALAVTATATVSTVDGHRLVSLHLTTTNSGAAAVGPLRLTLGVPLALIPIDAAAWDGCHQDRSGVAEGQVWLQCPYPAGVETATYTFRQDGPLGLPPVAFIIVEQGEQRILERDLQDNQVELTLPT